MSPTNHKFENIIFNVMGFFVQNSLLRLDPAELNKMALECFACIMRYMGDLGLLKNQTEVDCVNTILVTIKIQQNIGNHSNSTQY